MIEDERSPQKKEHKDLTRVLFRREWGPEEIAAAIREMSKRAKAKRGKEDDDERSGSGS